ncbi:regulator of microtubule dynamics protein 1 [Phthorimaea operculella]|nr:regulator of microtubule dynamics protein 1 [Phthorimaea operculella]
MGRLYKFYKQGSPKYSVNSQVNTLPLLKLNLNLGLAWAFIWTASKEKKSQIESKNDLWKKVIEKADDLFENGHYEECYEVLKEANEQGKNVEVLWRTTRALYNMSKQTKYNNAQKKSMVNDAFLIISDLLQTHYDNYAVQKWYALMLDAKSSYDGVSERIKQLENVKKHMDLAVTLNPEDATTLYMLGEWCYQITEMPWHQRKIAEVLFATPPTSSYEDALEYFLRAEAVQPRFYSLNLLRLGSCYLKLEKEDQAKYYLKLAASYPAKSNDDHQANKEAAELLKRMK